MSLAAFTLALAHAFQCDHSLFDLHVSPCISYVYLFIVFCRGKNKYMNALAHVAIPFCTHLENPPSHLPLEDSNLNAKYYACLSFQQIVVL